VPLTLELSEMGLSPYLERLRLSLIDLRQMIAETEF
jgi:hypothetical protein